MLRAFYHVIAPAVSILSALFVVIGFVLNGLQIISLGLPIWAWQAISAAIFFLAVSAVVYQRKTEPSVKSSSVAEVKRLDNNQTDSDKSTVQPPAAKKSASRRFVLKSDELQPPKTIPVTETVKDRIFVDVSTAFLEGFFSHKEYTEVQSKKLAEPYIGKWLKVRGEVRNVDEMLGLHFVSIGSSPNDSVLAYFGKDWVERICLLRRGDTILTVGQIQSIGAQMVTLINCELTSV